jgi:hypothetical protein
VPVALVEEYNQPSPQPSDTLIKKVKEVVAQLNADDWKARDRAETQLVGMGPAILGTLKQLRGDQNPEAQQRIDSVVKQLDKQSGERKTGPAGATGTGPGVPQNDANVGQQGVGQPQAPVVAPVQQQIEQINAPARP